MPRDSPLAIRSRWSAHGKVRIHWLESGYIEADHPPLIFIPGFGEEARDHLALIEHLHPRRVIVPDLRGRGPSDAPATGYGLAEHVGDLDAVLRDAGVQRAHVASYSRGTAYSLRWAIEHPEHVASLAVGDYPAAHIRPPEGAVDFLASRNRFGRPMTERVSERIMRAIFAACEDETYYDSLARFHVPVLLMYGGRDGSMIDDEILDRYRRSCSNLTLDRFDDSAHDLWLPDPARFARHLGRFTDAADGC